MIKENLIDINARIEKAAQRAGRDPRDIRLICVTKEANSSDILDAVANGAKELGENRVKDAVLKHRAISDKVTWHLIGHLQTNKVKDAVQIFELIHSVDSLRLAQHIDKESRKITKIQEVLIEVNVSGEGTKFGITPSELGNFLKSANSFGNLHITGLMTVTPFTDTPEGSRKYFKTLKELRDKFGLKELSMGMTQDYEIAVEEGASMLRVGRAIFCDS